MKKQISNDVAKKVQSFLDNIGHVASDKAARILGKSYSKDVKLNRFLAAKFEQGLTLFTDKERREKILNSVEPFGITNVQEKQALIIKVLNGDIAATVEAKRLEITNNGKMILNNEQKAALTSKLVEYQNFLTKSLLPGAQEIATSLGVLEDVKEDKQTKVAKAAAKVAEPVTV